MKSHKCNAFSFFTASGGKERGRESAYFILHSGNGKDHLSAQRGPERRRRQFIKTVRKSRRSKRIAGPYPVVGDISLSGAGKRALSRLPIRFSHFAALTQPSRERTITFFLFSFNYRCQGVVPAPLSLSRSHSRCSLLHPGCRPPTFSPCSTCLYYSFIYSNYLHDVNLTLPLISLRPRALSTGTPPLVDDFSRAARRLLKARGHRCYRGAYQDVRREFSG